MARAAGPGAFDRQPDLDLASPFEDQRDGHAGALFQRGGQADQHQVEPARHQPHLLPGGQVDRGDGAHPHHIALADMGVQFHHIGRAGAA
jgi:hypothetical protein